MPSSSGKLYCPKCNTTKADSNFYKNKDGTYCELCKKCLTMHMDVFNEETYLWAFEKFDIPYIKKNWERLREKEFDKNLKKAQDAHARDPEGAAYQMTRGSDTLFGKYLGTMKLKNYKDYCYADSDKLNANAGSGDGVRQKTIEEIKAEQERMEELYAKGEISEAQYLTFKGLDYEKEQQRINTLGSIADMMTPQGEDPYPQNDNPYMQVDLPDVGADLTDEDKVYLALKWGRLYSPEDWVTLEKQYSDYEESFDLHSADLISGTKQLCKLDLKSNQALDSGDIDSYSKLARASDSLRKSLKFTEAQRKEDKSSEFSCYGQLVSYCELKGGYIPRIDLDVDRDIIDADLRDIKNYNQTLIKEDPAVYKMIEQYIKKRDAAEQQARDKEEAKAKGLDYVELSDDDLKEYDEQEENMRAVDNGEEDDDD